MILKRHFFMSISMSAPSHHSPTRFLRESLVFNG
nr:MAG TPA: hypothetical protein [Caudoviricetes sp.]